MPAAHKSHLAETISKPRARGDLAAHPVGSLHDSEPLSSVVDSSGIGGGEGGAGGFDGGGRGGKAMVGSVTWRSAGSTSIFCATLPLIASGWYLVKIQKRPPS